MNEQARAQAANRPRTRNGQKTASEENKERIAAKQADEVMSKSETPTTTDEASTDTTESDGQRLYAAPTGPNTYTVLSRGDAGRNAYSVDVANLTCTCEDFQYNVAGDADRNVCKHLEKAISIHPHKEAYYSYKGGQVAKVDVTQSAAPSKEEAEAVEDTESAITQTPKDAHDKLKTSLDGTDIAFKTQLDVERIWFGFDEYVEDGFEKYISGPEMVEYDPDNSPDGFKNYVEAGDVEAYISEVLA